ncbi:MAG: MBL fold metallo-hydrolase, partial [Bdellovibrio sp.]|nr:MBL fold metallo-hydrolase [Bdellovibrio sp.]
FFSSFNDFSPGRIHYALAVGGALYALECKQHKEFKSSFFESHVLLAFGSWVFVALWDAFSCHLIAFATPVLTLISFPFFILFLFPIQFLGILALILHLPEISVYLFHFTGNITEVGMTYFLKFAFILPQVWVVQPFSLCLGLFAAGLLLFIVSGRRKINIFIIFLVTLFILRYSLAHYSFKSEHYGSTALWVEQLDVGQGDAALVAINKKNHIETEAGMIDVGSERALRFDNWLKLFIRRGISKISWIALTHLDEDHVGGVFKLAKLMPLGCVVTAQVQIVSEKGQKIAKKLKKLGISLCIWESGCFPYPVFVSCLGKSKNNQNMSMVWVPLKNGNYFSMGDADNEQEKLAVKWFKKLREKYSLPLAFKISHHGSKYSSSQEILAVLRPKIVWISSGAGNFFGHPSLRVIGLLKDHNILFKRTDLDGYQSSL